MAAEPEGPASERVRVRRVPKRGVYDRDTIHAILDASPLCHLGFVVDGQPYVVPTLQGRDGDHLFVHGSAASRALRGAAAGLPVCVTVTLLDGLVMARSAFHHSVNYRSVVVLGVATEVEDADQKLTALRTVSESVAPGRWDEVRQPDEQELRATTVLRLPIDEASAKVRTGGAVDEPEDLDFPVWAGVVPRVAGWGEPVADAGVTVDVPESVRRLLG